jgi:hypothetical protein
MGLIMGSQNIMGSDYGSNISELSLYNYRLLIAAQKKKHAHTSSALICRNKTHYYFLGGAVFCISTVATFNKHYSKIRIDVDNLS